MVFSSLLFLFYFLPAVLVVYFLVPRRFKNVVLLVFSLAFYGWGEPVYVLLMVFSILMDYSLGRWMHTRLEKGNVRAARRILVLSVVCNLALLAFFKYADFLIGNLNGLFGLGIPKLDLPLPIGISFYTFQAMSYLIDLYRGDVPVQKSLVAFGTYVSLFPQLIAGPIVRMSTVSAELSCRRETADLFSSGIRRFVAGLGKKVLLANNIGAVWTAISQQDVTTLPVLTAWIGLAAFTLQIYFDFSGYSDMAIGLGRMFGFHFLENFNYPYTAVSVTDFWRRWHISLSGWFRDYLYIPLGGNRKGKVRTWLNQLIVFFCTGLWHGANVTFIVWGLFHGALLIAESSGLLNVRKWRFKGLAHMYTLLMVTVGFVIFRADTMGDAWLYLKAMFTSWSVGGVTLRQAVGYLTPYFLLLTAAAALACTPVWPRLQEAARRRAETGGGDGLARAVRAGSYALSGAALLLCLFALATDSYNPFIYFRF